MRLPNPAHQRTRKFIANAAGILAGKVAYMAAGFLLVRQVVQVAGIEAYGMWAVCAHLVALAGLLDLGLSLGLQNRISHCIHLPTERAHLAGICSAVAAILALIAVVLVAGLWAVWAWSPGLVDGIFGPGAETSPVLDTGRRFLVVVALVVAVSLPLQVPQRILAGLQEQGRTGVVQGLTALATAAAVPWMEPSLGIAGAVAIAVLLPTAAPAIYAVARLRRLGHDWLLASRPEWRSAMTVIRAGVFFLVSQVAALVVFQTDVILVSMWHGPQAAASYEACARLVGLAALVQGVALAGLWPAVAQGWAQSDHAWVRSAYSRARLATVALLAPLALAAAVFIEPLFYLWTGDRTLDFDPRLVWGYAAFTLSTLWANLHAMCLNATGDERHPALVALLQAGLNFVLCLAMVHVGPWAVAWTSAGVAVATNGYPLYRRCMVRLYKR